MVEYEDKLYFLNPYIVSIDSNLHFCDNYIPLSVFYYAFGDKESERLAFQGIENSIQSIFVVKNKYLLLQMDEMIKFMNIEILWLCVIDLSDFFYFEGWKYYALSHLDLIIIDSLKEIIIISSKTFQLISIILKEVQKK